MVGYNNIHFTKAPNVLGARACRQAARISPVGVRGSGGIRKRLASEAEGPGIIPEAIRSKKRVADETSSRHDGGLISFAYRVRGRS
jgi:hypothetical protein